MRISWNWLRRYLDLDITAAEAAEVLTSTGLETESVTAYEPVKGMLSGVVVGHVLECSKHPDADRLSVCMVDLGEGEPVQIVCGAPNVAKGQKVLVATVGSMLHMKDGNSITIKKSKIRGQESNGMICAEDELGLGDDHGGIIVLAPEAPVGFAAAEHLGLVSDQVLEIGLTPNRTDAMGHVGVARDLRAALVHRQGVALDLELPDVSAFQQDDEAMQVHVEVKDPHACPRYAGVTLTNVKVGPSPKWLQDLLLAIGLKPINNVVDVTNFVQHELAQPLHAFDADRLEGRKIIVRKAGTNEPFRTLDGKERQLHQNDLVIADGLKPACIAGVFGGEFSGVSATTTNVFLESAYFDPATIRATGRRHGLHTDASFRFERGIDPEITVYALKRAALLLKEVAGAKVSSAITDIDHTPKIKREVKLKFQQIGSLAGLEIPKDDVVQILELLDFRVKDRNDREITVEVPKYRVDVYRPADIVEEVLRIHGFDHVPLPERLMCPPVYHEALDRESLRLQLGAHLAARGLREVMTPSLVGKEKVLKAGVEEASLVELKNPLSGELDVMRPSMVISMLGSIAHNINRQNRDLRFFERGRIYRKQQGSAIETDVTAIAITGAARPESWRQASERSSLFDLKDELESVLARLGLRRAVEWQQADHVHLKNAQELVVIGHPIGVFGEVDQALLQLHDVNQPVYFAELKEAALLQVCRSQGTIFQEIPRTPAVRRDLSMLLNNEIHFGQLQKLAFNAERKLLKQVDLFDVYQGDKLPKGRKSYAMSFILQDADRTLTDEQVEKAMARIRSAFEKEAGAELRS
jgi:phenylalanyl-tRNA synthetase beta chain